MVADVKVGCFLSGGLDSSIITAIASKLSSTSLKTFTAGFKEYEEEIKNAEEVASLFGTEHHQVIISPRMFVDSLPELIKHYDQPISFASSIPLHFISKLAKEKGVGVILTGEGADELFAGYSRYRRIKNFMDISMGHGIIPYFNGITFKIASKFLYDPRYLKMIELIMNGNNYDYLTGINSIMGKERDKYLLKSNNKNKNNPLRAIVKRLYTEKDIDILNRLLYLDWNTYLQELLTKQDRMSMSASIESRVPFLDNKIVDFANSLSPELKLNDGVGKYILRKVAKDILPKEVIDRKKIGFSVPLNNWFQGPLHGYLKEQLLDNETVNEFFGEEYVTTLLKRQKRHNCSLQLWAILNFKIWYEQHFKNG